MNIGDELDKIMEKENPGGWSRTPNGYKFQIIKLFEKLLKEQKK